jgi:hypothetical protein
MFLAIWQSAYSSDLYRKVQHWRGQALVYLALVIGLCWTPIIVKMAVTVNRAVQQAEPGLLAQVPVIEFSNGQIKTPENRPYLITLGEAPQTMTIIVDTSGHYLSLDGQTAQILLTKDKCFIRQRAGEVRTYDLSKSQAGRFVLDQDLLRKLIRIFKRWVLAFSFIFIVLLSYLKRLMQALLIALIGLGVASSLDTNLDLGELLSLAIVSMTPVMIMETLWTLAGGTFPFIWIFWAFLIFGYNLFAINAAAAITHSDE